MELSNRLAAVAAFVEKGAFVADIGTDHGYVPIFLVEQEKADRVIAMDINRGPLERARKHIIASGMSDRIEIRLSDGLSGLSAGEADTMIAAGMGGGLMIRIMEEGKKIMDSLSTCILQPQSEIDKVRRYLTEHGLVIEKEDMVLEDGKYYSMMRAVHGEPEHYEECEYLYGKKLLQMRHPVLKQFLIREQSLKEAIAERLAADARSEGARERLRQLEQELDMVRQALLCYGQSA